MKLEPGDKVHYCSGSGNKENGIVKSQHATLDDIVFVVYKCAGDWDNYYNYTGVATPIYKLKEDWI